MIRFTHTLLLILVCSLTAQAQYQIRSFEDIAALIRQKNTAIRNGAVELEKARTAKLASLMSIPDPTGSLSAGYTNNLKLPVNIFPAEILGGTPGTFRTVQLGTRYNSAFTGNIDVKLLNLSGIQNYQLAKVNISLTETGNQLTLKNIYDNATTIFYNLKILEAQQVATKNYLFTADSLHRHVQAKYTNGLASMQDLNEVKITQLNYQESLKQIGYQIEYQISNLKAVIGLSDSDSLMVSATPADWPQTESPVNYQLNEKNSRLQLQFAQYQFRKERFSFLPTLSFQFGYQSNLYDTQSNPFNSEANWIPSSYLGLRLSMPLPTAGQVSTFSRLKYDVRVRYNALEQARQQDALEQKTLGINLQKAKSDYNSRQAILALYKDNYAKNALNYGAGLVTLNYTLTSLNALIDAEYASIAAQYKVDLAIQNIKNHNSIR